MIGIKVNVLIDPPEKIKELIDFVNEPCALEFFTPPHHFAKQKQLISKISHPLLSSVTVHMADDLSTCPSDPLVNPAGYSNCIKQLKMVPEGGAILFHPFGFGLSPEKRVRTLKEDFRVTCELADIAEQRNVSLLKENIPSGFPFPHGRSAEDMEFLTRHSNVSPCLDFSHQGMTANFSGNDPYFREEFRQYCPHFDLKSFLTLDPHYFHVSDHLGPSGEGLELGKGERDWDFLSRLEGTFVLEIMHQHENDFALWRKNIPVLKSLLSGKNF